MCGILVILSKNRELNKKDVFYLLNQLIKEVQIKNYGIFLKKINYLYLILFYQ